MLTSVGRRTAHASISHFISEFVARMKAAGMSDRKTCDFPLTQEELGDALGLSTVHVNRTVKKLRQNGLVSWHPHSLTIRNLEGLNEIADFDDAYLELRSSVTGA
jgi:CRP-like cAMP-binding protein